MTTSESLGPTASGGADADAGFGVYIHWPFCLAKCPYCDFNSHVRAEPVDEERSSPPSRPRSPIAPR